jgi:hypothetical protein
VTLCRQANLALSQVGQVPARREAPILNQCLYARGDEVLLHVGVAAQSQYFANEHGCLLPLMSGTRQNPAIDERFRVR